MGRTKKKHMRTRRPARRRKVTRVPCSNGCGAMVPSANYHHTVSEHGERWTCAPDAPERKPTCLRELGCLCAGHARGNPADAPCDTSETPALGDPLSSVCCAVCGGLNVQYPVWHNPNTGEVFDLFGSWNNGDNTFCADCDNNGRDPNPPLVDKGAEPEEYLSARSLRLGDSRGDTFIAPKFDSEGKRIETPSTEDAHV